MDFNPYIAQLLKQAKKLTSQIQDICYKNSLKDIENLETFYKDREYRKTLESATYLSSEYFQLESIEEQEEKLREGAAEAEN